MSGSVAGESDAERQARWERYRTEHGLVSSFPPPVPDIWEDSDEVCAAIWVEGDGSFMIADPNTYDQAYFGTREGAIRFLCAVVDFLRKRGPK